MGVVWRAHDRTLGRDVAIKLLRPIVASDGQQRRRFEREARTLAGLANEHIVRVHDYVDDGEQAFLVMEFVDGRNLADTTFARLPLDVGEAAWYAEPVAKALAYAHAKGVVHRDLTPANILVEHETGRVVTTDFGLARVARSGGSLTTVGMLVGTPEYWSPEQALGRETGTATDLYALGCILYLLVGGRLPFEGDDRLAVGLRRAHEQAPSLTTLAPEVPAAAADLVDSLLSTDPGGRPDAAATAASLSALAAAPQWPARPVEHEHDAPPSSPSLVRPTLASGRVADGLRCSRRGRRLQLFRRSSATPPPSAGPSSRLPRGEPSPASARVRRRGRGRAARRSRRLAPARGAGPECPEVVSLRPAAAVPDPPVAAGRERVGPVGVLDSGVTRPGDQPASGGTDECRQWRGREADGEQGNAVRGGAGRPRRRVGAGGKTNAGAHRLQRTPPLHAVMDGEEGRGDRTAPSDGCATSASGDRPHRRRLRLSPRGRASRSSMPTSPRLDPSLKPSICATRSSTGCCRTNR